jgi:probable rRNA maturation factor
MNQIEIQRVEESGWQPDQQAIQAWVDAAFEDFGQDTEIVVRIVGEQESAELNSYYRHKPGPTNILSFPFEAPEGLDSIELNLLGDLVICAEVLEKEALEQVKPLAHHWAHIIVHGVLHLLGYDHLEDKDAELMESREINILKKLNINNPYHEAVEK